MIVHEGRTNFSELQADLAKGDQDRLLYYTFDLLWLDGTDLRKKPQIERKRLLKELFDTHGLKAPALYSEHLVGDGQQFFEHAAKLKYEGIISKRADAPYRSERTEAWLKVKSVLKGKSRWSVSSRTRLALPRSTDRKGNSSFTWEKSAPAGPARSQTRSASSLDTVITPKSKLTQPIKKPKATRVEPKFFADIEYRDITSDGLLRASSFKGLSSE